MAKAFEQEAAQYHALWDKCTLFYAGKQAANWITTALPVATIAPEGNGDTESFNITQAFLRQLLARMVTGYPSAAVLPVTPATDDIADAEAAQEILQYFWQAQEMDETYSDHSNNMLAYGNGVMLTAADGENVIQENIDPRDLRAEPGARSPKLSRFLGVIRPSTKAELKEQFPDKAEEIDHHAVTKPMMEIGMAQTRSRPADHCDVLEAYTRGTKGVPAMSYIMLGDVVLDKRKTPGNCMPIVVTPYIKIPNMFFGIGAVELIMGAQAYFDKFMEQILRNIHLMTNAKVFVDKNSDIPDSKITSAVGEVIEYEGKAPTVWTPPPIHQTLMNAPAMLQAIMQDLLCLHSASQGRRQAGDPSGIAIQEMKAADAVPLDLIELQIAMNCRKVCKNILLYIREYYPERKFTRQMGQTGALVFKTLHAARIDADPEVFIEASELFRSNAAARDARVKERLTMGLITAAQAEKELTQHLDPTSPLKMLRDLNKAHDFLNALIMTGNQTEFFPTDNLAVYEQVIKEYIDSPDFYDPNKTPIPTADAIVAAYKQVIAMMAGVPLPQDQTAPPQPTQPVAAQHSSAAPAKPPHPEPTMPGAESAQNAVATQELKGAEPPAAKA